MAYRILHNLSSAGGHGQRLGRLVAQCDEFLLVSPFMMPDISSFLNTQQLSRLRSLHVITTLQTGSPDQLNKARTFTSLFNSISGNTQLTISINNRLHGKIYVFKKEGIPFAAIISSANFTPNGLFYGHEWGIEIDDTSQIIELEASVLSSVEYTGVTREQAEKMEAQRRALPPSEPVTIVPIIPFDLNQLIPNARPAFVADRSVNYWLKPMGASGNWVNQDRTFDRAEDFLHFSTIPPSGVYEGDILIAYGIGWQLLLGLYISTGEPIHATPEEIEDDPWLERWPWYIPARNLAPGFGTNWRLINLSLPDMVDTYHELNPGAPVTGTGSTNFNAINHGKDKIRLDQEFAAFLINRMEEINNQLV